MLNHTLDPLTWLPGRQAFEERLMQAIRAASDSRAVLAAMRIDLDRMQVLNDLLGRDLSDRVLREAASRIARVLGPRVALARLQEDDFAAFALVDGLDAALSLASAVLAACRLPYVLGCVSVRATVSVGIALYPLHARDCAGLLAGAEDALRQAKLAGRNRCCATCSGGTARPPRRGRG